MRWPLGLAVRVRARAAPRSLSPPLRPVAYNVLLVLAFFFALQGLAVVAFYARRLAAPPLLRAAVMAARAREPWAPQILALLGLFDIWSRFPQVGRAARRGRLRPCLGGVWQWK